MENKLEGIFGSLSFGKRCEHLYEIMSCFHESQMIGKHELEEVKFHIRTDAYRTLLEALKNAVDEEKKIEAITGKLEIGDRVRVITPVPLNKKIGTIIAIGSEDTYWVEHPTCPDRAVKYARYELRKRDIESASGVEFCSDYQRADLLKCEPKNPISIGDLVRRARRRGGSKRWGTVGRVAAMDKDGWCLIVFWADDHPDPLFVWERIENLEIETDPVAGVCPPTTIPCDRRPL